jgi:predicted Na+-dependent transporter
MIAMILFVLRQLLTEVPLIIVCLGCIVAAFSLWQRAPSSSLYVVLACGFTLLLLIAYPAAWWCARTLGAQTQSAVGVAFSIGWSVARSIATIVLVVAVYAGRKNSHEDIPAG